EDQQGGDDRQVRPVGQSQGRQQDREARQGVQPHHDCPAVGPVGQDAAEGGEQDGGDHGRRQQPRKKRGGAGPLQYVHGEGEFEGEVARQGADLPQNQQGEVAVEEFFLHGQFLRKSRMRSRADARAAAPSPAHQKQGTRRPPLAKCRAAISSPTPASSSALHTIQRNRALPSQASVRRPAPASIARSKRPAARSTACAKRSAAWSTMRSNSCSVMVDTSIFTVCICIHSEGMYNAKRKNGNSRALSYIPNECIVV